MRVLCVAVYRSNHADRHVELLARHGIDVHLVVLERSALERPPLSAGVTMHEYSPPPGPRTDEPAAPADPLDARLLLLADRAMPSRGADLALGWLAALIDRLQPDILHSFAIHQASFLTLLARREATHRPIWIVSNWGCDIHHFGQDPRLRDEYLPAIRATLAEADGYFAETRRDVRLARKAGFRGKVLAVAPIGGGFDLAWFRARRDGRPPSARKLVMIKGYQGDASGLSVGQAAMAVEALEKVADLLDGYEVNFYATYSLEIIDAAKRLRDERGVAVRLHPFLPYEELMRLHGQARCSVGISETDGIATSAIEAMLMGSVPVQSDSSGLGEWVRRDGALLVPCDRPDLIAAALRRALTDDRFVDAAARSNDESLERRFSTERADPVIVDMYRKATPKRRGLFSFWR